MAVKKIYIVTDLGPGDGGKGSIVHKITTMTRAKNIIKVGGAQGSHGVVTSRGERFAFSQWGCATFEGVKTHLSSRMIIMPVGLLNEAEALRYQYGIHNAFDLLTIDERALCATPLHGIASRLKELARGPNPRGTIGTGVGEAYRYLQRFPELAIRAADLSRPDLKDVLGEVRDEIRRDLVPLIDDNFLPSDREEAQREIALLCDDGFLDYIVARFNEVSRLAKIVDSDYLDREILCQDGLAVVESSHGVLTDNRYGFHPHTSAISTLPCFTHAMLKEAGYSGEIVDIGIFRAYAIRHGAGPLPTCDPKMLEHLLPGSHKEENRFQGKVRVGPLDLVLLRYAIEVCGGPKAFQGIAVTWFDQIIKDRAWRICDRYKSMNAIEVWKGEENDEQLKYQKFLGKALLRTEPEITTLEIPLGAGQDELYSLCADVLYEKLGVPVRMVSFGPTELDKIYR